MSILILFKQAAIIFFMLGAGFIAKRIKIVSDEATKSLSLLLTQIALPCTIIASANLDIPEGGLGQILFGALLLAIFYVCSIITSHAIAYGLQANRALRAVFVSMTAFPNTAYIGFPFVTAVLGTLGTFYASSSVPAYNFLFFTYGVTLFLPRSKPQLRNFINPLNIATIIMLILIVTGWRLPSFAQGFFQQMGGMTTPIALLIIGIMLESVDLSKIITKKLLYLVSFVRCILYPLLFITVLSFLHLDKTLYLTLCIMGSCPAGSMAAVMAKQADMEVETASLGVVHSTLCVLLTMPLLVYFAELMYK